jgi:hypothetical protein
MTLVKDVRKTVTDAKPLYALAGAGDLVVERLRTLPTRLAALRPEVTVDRKEMQAKVGELPGRVVELPVIAQAKVVELGGAAGETYDDLVVRGRKIVRAVSRQKATQDLKADAATTIRRTKAAKNTAKTSATATRTATRKAAQSAAKTAESAAKAVEDGAGKVG